MNIKIKHTLKWVLFFILDYGSCFFCLFTTFLIICSSDLFCLFYMCIDGSGIISLKFLPSWPSVCGKPHYLACFVILGISLWFTHATLRSYTHSVYSFLFTYHRGSNKKHTQKVSLIQQKPQNILSDGRKPTLQV